MDSSIRFVVCGLVLLLLTPGWASGQGWFRGRAGLQMNASSVEKSIAPGVHLDAEMQIAGRYSVLAGAGFSAYLLEGRQSGTYAFDPRLTFMMTRPSPSTAAKTLFGGVGYRFPFGHREAGRGPTVHLGVGRMWALRESTIFVDLSPTAVLEGGVPAFVMSLRAGVVF